MATSRKKISRSGSRRGSRRGTMTRNAKAEEAAPEKSD